MVITTSSPALYLNLAQRLKKKKLLFTERQIQQQKKKREQFTEHQD